MTVKSTPLGGEPGQPGDAAARRRPQLRSPVRTGAVENLLENYIRQLNRQNGDNDARASPIRLGEQAGSLAGMPSRQEPKDTPGISPAEPGLALDAMKERIAEFATYVGSTAPDLSRPRMEARSLAARLDEASAEPAPETERRWFETRFDDLARLIEQSSASTQASARERDTQIQKRLDEISARLDRLEAAPGAGETIKAVERRLHELARHLDETKARGEARGAAIDALASKIDRIGKIGEQTALAVIQSAKQSKAAFEAAERTAQLSSDLTAKHVGEALRQFAPASRFEAIETEMRALNRHSREAGLKAARALEEIHNTMRQFLERVAEPAAAQTYAFAHAGAAAAAGAPLRPGITKPVIAPQREAKSTRPATAARPTTPLDPVQQKSTDSGPAAGTQAHAPMGLAGGPSDLEFEAQNGRRLKRGLFVAAFIMLLACLGMLYLVFMGGPERTPAVPGPKAALEIGPPQIARALKQARADLKAPSWTAVSVAGENTGDMETGQARRVAGLAQTPIGDAEDTLARTRRLAEQNHAVSQYRLATFYERGAGVPKDRALAEAWYRRAAEQGNVLAMHNLAGLYSSGGSANAREMAIKWFRLAADHGLTDSQYNLGVLLENGRDSDWPEACKWFTIAAEKGDMEAEWKRVRLRDRMTLAQIRAAEKMIAQWKALPWNADANGNAGRA